MARPSACLVEPSIGAQTVDNKPWHHYSSHEFYQHAWGNCLYIEMPTTSHALFFWPRSSQWYQVPLQWGCPYVWSWVSLLRWKYLEWIGKKRTLHNLSISNQFINLQWWTNVNWIDVFISNVKIPISAFLFKSNLMKSQLNWCINFKCEGSRLPGCSSRSRTWAACRWTSTNCGGCNLY